MDKRNAERFSSPLTTLKNGEIGIITTIISGPRGGKGGGWRFEKRLMDLGLTPGAQVTVVKSCPFSGPVEILVRGSRLALGRGMAERVLVEARKG